MKVTVKNKSGQEVGSVDLPASIFEANVNVGLMHQALVRQMANARRGTHKVKGRSEVNRTTRKIYRQKGTGNARHGSRRAPIFVGGGIAHGPAPRDYSKKMPRKMRRAAIRSALTVKASSDNLVLVDNVEMDTYKTKEFANVVNTLAGDFSTLVVIPGADNVVEKSASNLANVKALRASYLNVRDILGHDKLVISLDALDVLSGFLDTDESLPSNEIGEDESVVEASSKEAEE